MYFGKNAYKIIFWNISSSKNYQQLQKMPKNYPKNIFDKQKVRLSVPSGI